MKGRAVIIAALVGWVLIMARKAKASPLSGVVQGRVQQLVSAISGIEGGSPSNPGNIKDSLGNIAQDADLTAKINFDFVEGWSTLYSPDMSFRQLAWMYVAGTVPGDWSKVAPGDNPDNWAAYVAGQLGVPVDSAVGEFLQS